MTSIAADAVICAPLRTAVGRYGGMFRHRQAHQLAAIVIRAVVERFELPPAEIDDVLLGNCYPSMDAPAIGRVAALDAGLPVTVPGVQLDRRCGSGLQAVIDAVLRVRTGAADLVIAGGAESMSNAPFYSNSLRWGAKGEAMRFDDSLARGRLTAGGVNHPVLGGMIETAENLRAEYSISRAEQDEFALRSHRKAVAAIEAGWFTQEIVPVTAAEPGAPLLVLDEHPRADAALDALAALRPIRGSVDPEATVTAGNASGQNDGAAAVVVATPAKAAELGLTPMGRLVSWAVAGVEPSRMGIGPVPASAQALARAGLTMANLDLIELNEAFAAQVLACTREWSFGATDFERLNVNGSGISLGHPVGATGCRILVGLLHEMRRRDARYALETMCIGGAQGLAAVFARV